MYNNNIHIKTWRYRPENDVVGEGNYDSVQLSSGNHRSRKSDWYEIMKKRRTRRRPTPHGVPPARWKESCSGSGMKKKEEVVSKAESRCTARRSSSGDSISTSLIWSNSPSKIDS